MSEPGLYLSFEPASNLAVRRAVLATGLSASAAWSAPAVDPPLAAALLSFDGVAEIATAPGFLTALVAGAAH